MPKQKQQELSMAGKMDASTDEIKDFKPLRFQYQQMIPNHQLHRFNQMSPGTDKLTRRELGDQPSDDRHPPKVQGTYSYCNKKGRKIAEYRTKKMLDPQD